MTDTMNAPRVAVVVPNRDGRHHLAYSMPLLARTSYPNYEIIVSDNCSSDDSVAFLASRFPQAHVHRASVDRGFAGGVNAGIRLALAREAEYIAVFSNDIKVLPDWLTTGCAILQEHSRIGVLGYTELRRDDEAGLAMPREVTWDNVGVRLPGALYLCRADVLRAVGLFDEEYFMYGEETDLFARIRQAGYTIAQTNVPVWHYGGGYTAKAPLRVAWLAYRNGIRYAVKNEPPARILRQIFALFYFGVVSTSARPTLHAKLRPSSRVVNAGIWAAAVAWNLFNLPRTLRSKRRDERLIRQATEHRVRRGIRPRASRH